MAYRVYQCTHEIGVYIALGAQHREVMRLVMKNGPKLVMLGIALGLAGPIVFTRLMGSLLFEVEPTDPLTLIGVALLLASVALLACYIQVRRALSIHPMTALRCEKGASRKLASRSRDIRPQIVFHSPLRGRRPVLRFWRSEDFGVFML